MSRFGSSTVKASGFRSSVQRMMDYRARSPGLRTFDTSALTRLASENEILKQQLKAAREEIRRLHLRDDLLAVVSHDLRNPLEVVTMGCALLLKRGSSDEEGKQVRKQVAKILRAAARMEELIRNLLDAASMEAGRFSIDPKAHELGRIVRETIDMYALHQGDSLVRVETDVTELGQTIRCDKSRVLQVFANIIGNAVKFSPKGSAIRLGVRALGEKFVFEISDEGPGIPAEMLPHIFDRYWKNQSQSRNGTGLGLFIAKSIVNAHGGEITAFSGPAGGTTIAFTIPRVVGAEMVLRSETNAAVPIRAST